MRLGRMWPGSAGFLFGARKFWLKRYECPVSLGFSYADGFTDGVEVVSVGFGVLVADSSHFGYHELVSHASVPISCSGVQITGLVYPRSSIARCNAGTVSAFANCLQSQVKK